MFGGKLAGRVALYFRDKIFSLLLRFSRASMPRGTNAHDRSQPLRSPRMCVRVWALIMCTSFVRVRAVCCLVTRVRQIARILHQVVFSDRTEVLLSKEGRVVTFVEKDGKRETHSLHRVLGDQRWVEIWGRVVIVCRDHRVLSLARMD